VITTEAAGGGVLVGKAGWMGMAVSVASGAAAVAGRAGKVAVTITAVAAGGTTVTWPPAGKQAVSSSPKVDRQIIRTIVFIRKLSHILAYLGAAAAQQHPDTPDNNRPLRLKHLINSTLICRILKY
jgi:hypothetical protein